MGIPLQDLVLDCLYQDLLLEPFQPLQYIGICIASSVAVIVCFFLLALISCSDSTSMVNTTLNMTDDGSPSISTKYTVTAVTDESATIHTITAFITALVLTGMTMLF